MKLYKLFQLQCKDLLVLQEMEWNGMLFAKEAALEKAKSLQNDIDNAIDTIHTIFNCSYINVGSGNHISAILYGGIIEETYKVPVGHIKTGPNKGAVKYANQVLEHKFDRLVEPLKNTETAVSKKKDSNNKIYSVNEDILKSLTCNKKAKEVVQLILEYRRLEKLRGTYLEGWSKMIDENHWEGNYIHGNLNQAVVITGRLSSTSPNVQNCDKCTKEFLISRYE